MKFRHEVKHSINRCDYYVLRSRLSAVMKRDRHAQNGIYSIRSLYFDTPSDTALREKIDGINIREKFRLRYYNDDTSFIRLEKKSKRNGLCNKQSAPIAKEETAALLAGDIEWMKTDARLLLRELYAKMKTTGLQPKTVVDYKREPFVFAPGNVRVTLDSEIRTGLSAVDFLNPTLVTVPATDAIVLEVKWDEFLPQIIADAVSLPNRRSGAFSKYAVGRRYD